MMIQYQKTKTVDDKVVQDKGDLCCEKYCTLQGHPLDEHKYIV